MTELDHLPRHEIGDVDPDVPLRQIRRLCNRRRYLRDELVLTLGGAACADLAVDKDLMAFQWTAADEVAIECDLSENDLCKVAPVVLLWMRVISEAIFARLEASRQPSTEMTV